MILRILLCLAVILMLVSGPSIPAQDKPGNPRPIKHQITGLFCPERETALCDAFAKMPKFKLTAVDFDNAEITVKYDPTVVWPGEKPERYVELFANEIGNASRNTFRAKPLRPKSLDKLKRVEIPVTGLDCLGCSYGAYRIVFELPGVEMATADFKRGRVTALIDPTLTDQSQLEEALKKAGVEITPPAK